MKFFTFFTFIALSCFAGYIDIEDQSGLTILTPSLQNRKTAKIQLANGMKVYLVSDPSTDQSAASVAVNAGSWQDPKEYPGMAHFLEHMLFMGTKPYPSENDFFQYVANQAGNLNAYTASDRTVYMFSTNNDGFDGALDRFSHFFIDPLFNPEKVGRELFVVDQEHAKNIENDNWRLYMVSKEIGNPNHPNAKFSTGNSATLSKIPHEELKQWYKTHYSAHLMHLVIYSNKPLDELKELVSEKFSQIPTNNKEPFKIDQKLSSEKQKKTIVYVKPIKNTQKVYLEWELPKFFAKDKTKSVELLAYALNRGQRYSLKQILKADNLIEDLSIGTEKIGNHHCLFQISLELTEKGLKQHNIVIKRCFEAIDAARASNIPDYLFDEKQTIANLKYQYQERVDAFEYVKDHAHNLVDESLSTYPKNTILATGYSAKRLQKLINYLTVENAHIYIVSPPELLNITLNQKEKWMGAEYAFKHLQNKQLATFTKNNLNTNIRIAPPSPFLPINLSLLNTPQIKEDVQIAVDDEFGKIIYLGGNEFKTPEIALHLHILSPLLNDTLESAVLSKLFVEDLNQALNPTISCALDANLNASISSERCRLNLSIDGFSEKIPLFIEEVFKEITHSKISPSGFETIKTLLRKSYENFSKELPIIQAIGSLKSALSSDIHTHKKMLNTLNKISYESYLAFKDALFKKTYIEGIFAGNLSLKDVESIYLDIRHFISQTPYPIKDHPKRKVFTINENNGPYFVQTATKALGQGIVLTIDQGEFSFQNRASQEILGQIVQEAFFDTLRSKQKTAYIAKAWPTELEKRLFLNFAVQSSTHEPIDLLYRFELFLEEFLSNFSDTITLDRFDTIRKNQIEKLKTSQKNLSIKSATIDKIAFEYQDLNWIDKRIKGLEKLSFEDFKSYILITLSKKNTKRLAILVKGTSLKDAFSYEITSLQNLEKLGKYTENSPIVSKAD
jgi:insulysin